jgi:transposase
MAEMVRLAGIDVSKLTLDVYVMPSGESRTVSYDRQGLGELRRWLLDLGVAVAAVEASGRYEREAGEVLGCAGLVIHRLNSLRVRRYAELAQTNASQSASRPLQRSSPPCSRG